MGDSPTSTTALVIQAVRDLGGWFGKHLDGPASEISGMVQDRLKFARAVRVIRLAERFIDSEEFNLNFSVATSSDGDGSNRHEKAVARRAA